MTGEFVETSVWERIDWVCRRALLRKKVAFVYGDSQIGKTTCLQERLRRNPAGHAFYVELPPAGGVQLMTRTIARALKVSSETRFEKLLLDVREDLDDSKLLIIDEIHRVFTTYPKSSVMRCLDVLRWLHDQTRCALVLCGTNVGFRDKLRDGEFSRYLQQLRRRGLYELQLPPVPPRADLDLIAVRYGLEPAAGEAEEIMTHIAREDGFGKFCIRLLDAVELAQKKKVPVTWEHFVKVHSIAEKMARMK